MNDEIIRELWDIKDDIAREFDYDVDALARHFNSKEIPSNKQINEENKKITKTITNTAS